jgi:hypothetical protein
MKALIGILFSAFFLLTTMQEVTFVVLYKLNEKSITERYCINKNVKGSCCHGSCHLNKTIAASENESGKHPFSTITFKLREVEITCHKIAEISFTIPDKTVTTVTPYYSSTLLKGITNTLLKPPAA